MTGSDSLRERAEKLVKFSDDIENLTKKETEKLIQELRVYQIELELQNEQLLNTQVELEGVRQRYVRLFNHAPIGYIVLDPSGIVSKANETFLRMLEANQGDVVYKAFADLIYSEDIAKFRGRYRSFFSNPVNKTIDIRLLRRGKIFHARLAAVPHQEVYAVDKLGAQQHELLVTVSDISEEVKNNQALVENEKILRAIFENQGEGVAITDNAGKFIYVNPATENFFAEAPGALIGMNIKSFIHTEIEGEWDKLKHALRSEEKYQNEFELIRQDGSVLPVLLTATARKNEHELISGIVFVFMDYSRQKRILEDLENQKMLDTVTDNEDEIIHLCANCNKIRDKAEGQDKWLNPADYFYKYEKIMRFSHGLCPDCVNDFFPGTKPVEP